MKTTNHNKALGKLGEDIAVDYLTKKGYIIIERNAFTPFGEIDIVAKIGEKTVFVEVKTRSTEKNGLGREAITEKKRLHMLKSAQYYADSRLLTDIGIDVIEIMLNRNSVTHFKDALV